MDLPGLTTEEAQKRLVEFGPNEINEGPNKSKLLLLSHQFRSPLALILVIASLLSLLSRDSIDAFLIFIIVILNGILGFWQEYKAEKILKKLKRLAISAVRVVRDSLQMKIDSKELVPGDIVILESGDRIPADGKIRESAGLQVNESALTGESITVAKETKGENNQLYLGTSVVKGRVVYEVTATGEKSRFGQIAQKLGKIKDEQTPLEKEISSLGKKLGVLAIVSAAFVFFLGSSQTLAYEEMFFTAVSLAVAAVPEGLPAIITITLAVGTQRMSRKKALIRQLSAVEALGAVEVICTDKTGTLTRNEMKVRRIWLNSRSFQAEEKEVGLGDPHFVALLQIMVNANSASLIYKENHGSFDLLGDPLEGALLLFAASSGIDPSLFKKGFPQVTEFPFEANLRTMSVVCQVDAKLKTFVKGAPEVILEKSNYLMLGNKKRPLNSKMRGELKQIYEKYAQDGLRVLGFASKEIDRARGIDLVRGKIESDLVLVGFIGIADPPREEVKKSLHLAEQAGIMTVMVTGDNELTARSIAKEIGLLKEGDNILTGEELEKINDSEALKLLGRVRIFARSSPEDKLRIVELFQKKGYTTAVTGDGINDSLALKKADVGIAMGLSGTDVAKEAADIVITDDNYATIVQAVEEGRVIYDNVVKGVRYLLSNNIAEVLFITLSLILSLPVPLYPVQILWLNLVTDGLPALALTVDPKDPLVMKKPPRDKSRRLADGKSLAKPVILGIIVAAIVLGVYLISLSAKPVDQARTISFSLLIVMQMVLAIIISGNKLVSNKSLLLSILLTLGIQGLMVTVPPLQTLFKLEPFW